jgi:rare lipoprotein A (RlpA)-like double-psi beta-barrel protein
MNDLLQFLRKDLQTKQVVLSVVVALILFAAGPASPSLEGSGPVNPVGHALPALKLATPNPSIHPNRHRAPLKSFVCLSSWYGDQFDGQLTANGEIYDMYGQTAAHKTLPLGSVVRVVNLKTHRSAVVRINDRGPYVPGRQLDVSYQVARELGFDKRGLARVRVDLLKVPESASTQPGTHPGN